MAVRTTLLTLIPPLLPVVLTPGISMTTYPNLLRRVHVLPERSRRQNGSRAAWGVAHLQGLPWLLGNLKGRALLSTFSRK